MLKGQDILVLLKLCGAARDWTMRSLGDALDLDPASVHRALRRLEEARLVAGRRRRVNRANAEEFLLHGLKYVFPARQSGPSRGFPTAWAAPPLSDVLAPSSDPPPVWPDPNGKVRGIALMPVHEGALEVARRDPLLAEELALLDAIRLGDARVRALAGEKLTERLSVGATTAP